MKYKEMLQKIKELKIDIGELTIADECKSNFCFKYTDEEFEKICNLLFQCYLEGKHITPNALAKAVSDIVVYDKYSVEKILTMSKSQIIEQASYYL